MKKMVKTAALLSLSCMLFAACDNDDANDSGTQPTADFAFKIKSDLTVTFTNNSEDGESYAWDFGDGSTSTDEAPSHKYAEKKSYTVKLTVANGAKTDEATKTLDLVNNTPAVDIDGEFADWTSVTGFSMPDTATANYGIAKAKVTSDNTHIYFYAEIVKEVAAHLSLYFRLSSTPNTYQPWMWGNKDIDALVQFTDLNSADWTPEAGDATLLALDKSWGTDWPTFIDLLPAGSKLWEVSGIKDLTTKATFAGTEYALVGVEISMNKSLIPQQLVPSETFGVGFYLQNTEWADAGGLPVVQASSANRMYTYSLTTKALTW
jgi:PKD repeat protein